jgi:acyl-CoA synthetase (NDP forming)
MYERTAHAKRPVSRAARLAVDRARVKKLFAAYDEKGQTQVDPEDCRVVLEAYGIPFAPLKVASDFDEAEQFAREMTYPVVLKIVSPQIVHKTDVGGVVLNIKDSEELEDAYYDTVNRARRQVPGAEIYGVSIQKMMPQGRELILGMAKDPQFGALIMAGFGGIYVEAFNDVAFRLAPLSAWDAGHMLRELKAYSLLMGLRGERAADVEAVEDVLLRISRLALDHPVLSEMDINPLMVYNAGDGCACVDIRMTLGG